MDEASRRGGMRRAIVVALVLLAAGVSVWVMSGDRGTGDAAPAPPAGEPPVERPPPERVHPPGPVIVPPRAIRVVVTGLDGTPVSGARIELIRGPADEMHDDDFHPSGVAPPPERAEVVGADGAAVLADVPPGRWFVVAHAPGFARHVLAGIVRGDDEAPVDGTIALERGHEFRGTVRDPDGAPAAGIAVVLAPTGDASTWTSDVACRTTTTAKDGAFRFDGVEAGRYRLWYAPQPGFFVEAATLYVPGLDGLDVRMVRGAAIEGTVRDDASGEPVAGARVLAINEWATLSRGSTTVLGEAVSDAGGRFALHTWKRHCELSWIVVDAPGYAASPVGGAGEGPPGAVADGQRFVYDLRLRRPAALHGKVLGPDGPLAGFQVGVWPDDDADHRLPGRRDPFPVSGADGGYRIERAPAGRVKLRVRDPIRGVGAAPEAELDLVPGTDATHDIRLEVETTHLMRRVVDEKEQPIEGVEAVAEFGTFRAEARTDADGEFQMDAAFAGDSVKLRLRREGFRESFELVYREEPEGLVRMRRVSEVTGTVANEDGSPAAGVRVLLFAGMLHEHGAWINWTGSRETVTALDGTFRLPVTAGRDHWLRVARSGDIADTEWDDAESDVVPVAATLPGYVRVSGRAVAEDGGEPVAGALFRDRDESIVARTGADGRFAFDRADDGGQVRVTGDGRLPAPLETTDEEQRIALRPARDVTGVVRLAEGTPVSGLRVVVRPPGAEEKDYAPREQTSATDADGRFIVPGWGTGPCELTVSDPAGNAHGGVRVTALAGGPDVAIVVTAAALLSVEAVDAAGAPVPEAWMTVRSETGEFPSAQAHSDAAGRMHVGLAPGATYVLSVQAHGDPPVERRGVRGGGEPLRIVLAPTQPR